MHQSEYFEKIMCSLIEILMINIIGTEGISIRCCPQIFSFYLFQLIYFKLFQRHAEGSCFFVRYQHLHLRVHGDHTASAGPWTSYSFTLEFIKVSLSMTTPDLIINIINSVYFRIPDQCFAAKLQYECSCFCRLYFLSII